MELRPEILIIEDNEADRMLLEVCAGQCERPVSLHFAIDGPKALDFLRGAGGPRPHLILLDLNLPRKDGREVLTELKGDAELKDIPVIVMSTSDNKTDRSQCYSLGALDYLVKPNSLDRYQELVGNIIDICYKLPTIGEAIDPAAKR